MVEIIAQKDRENNGGSKITRWRVMLSRLKEEFIPRDYELELFKKF